MTTIHTHLLSRGATDKPIWVAEVALLTYLDDDAWLTLPDILYRAFIGGVPMDSIGPDPALHGKRALPTINRLRARDWAVKTITDTDRWQRTPTGRRIHQHATDPSTVTIEASAAYQ